MVKASLQSLSVIISLCLLGSWVTDLSLNPLSISSNPLTISANSYKYNATTNLSTLYGIYFKNNIQSFRKEKAAKLFKNALTLFLQKEKISSIFITDIGANRGQIFDFKWINNATTHAFFLLIEPNPRIISNLSTLCSQYKNIYEQKLHSFNCNVLNYALTSSYVANKSMVFRVNRHNSQLSRLINTHTGTYKHRKRMWIDMPVDIVTFDWIMNNRINVSFQEFNMLKIDTEGYDASIMLGAYESISNFDIILWECSRAQLEKDGGPGTTHYSTAKYLQALSFDSYKLGTKMTIPLNLKYYNSIYDTSEYMNWHNCVAINQKSKYYCPIKNILCENCQNDTYSLCSYEVCKECH